MLPEQYLTYTQQRMLQLWYDLYVKSVVNNYNTVNLIRCFIVFVK